MATQSYGKVINVGNLPTGGDIVAASAFSAARLHMFVIRVAQTTPGQTMTLPIPLSEAATPMRVTVLNPGTTDFTIYGNTVQFGVSTKGTEFIWDGAAWVLTIALASMVGVLAAANNLSDLASIPTARTNLGLAASATTDTTNAANISSGALPAGRMPALTGDVTSTAGAVATTIAAGAVTFAKMASAAIATAAQFLSNTANLILTTDKVWGAAALVTLTDATTIAVDMGTLINGTVTLAGNRTLGAPTNTKVGQAGSIIIKQDATGSRTLAYNAVWKFPGASAPTLSTAASKVDRLDYFVESSTIIHANLTKGIA